LWGLFVNSRGFAPVFDANITLNFQIQTKVLSYSAGISFCRMILPPCGVASTIAILLRKVIEPFKIWNADPEFSSIRIFTRCPDLTLLTKILADANTKIFK